MASAIYFLSVTLCACATNDTGNSGSYDNGGTISVEPWKSTLDAAGYKKLKTFIWDHWINRRRGVVIMKGASIEGEPSRTTILIGPDNEGRWRVSLQTTVQASDRISNKPKEMHVNDEAYEVVRVEPQSSSNGVQVEIPSNARRSSGLYYLILKEKSGKVVMQL